MCLCVCPQLLDIVKDPHSRTPSLIFEYVDNTDFKVRSKSTCRDTSCSTGST